ncbi:unnamed protein product [Orchesella dallaii]|uniref:C2H2-type domain-containing protein n=1 Tax=Orchesella dallaii TaxID=48710 RepID=A0ABP1S0T8_9HEXA
MDTFPNPNDKGFLCTLCYKQGMSMSMSHLPKFNKNLSSRFLPLLSRYLGTNSKQSKVKEVQLQSAQLAYCAQCYKLVSSFCTQYSQLERLKLEMDWKIKRICERMVHAGKVPARGIQFRSQFKGEKKYEEIHGIRRNLIKSCQTKLTSSQPRLHIKRLEDEDVKEEIFGPKTLPAFSEENCLNEEKMLINRTSLTVANNGETQVSTLPFDLKAVKFEREDEEIPDRDPLGTHEDDNHDDDEDSRMEIGMEFKVKVELDNRNVSYHDQDQDDSDTDPLTNSTPMSPSTCSLSSSGGPGIPPTQCERCGSTFECEAAVEKHRVVVHHLKNYVRCSICLEMFEGYSSYRLHRTKQSTQVAISKCFTSNSNNLVPAAAPEYPTHKGGLMGGHYFCSFEGCYEVFQFEQRLQIHLKTHGNWRCNCCQKLFLKAHHLVWHEIGMEKPTPATPWSPQQHQSYKCSRCSRTFEKNVSMTNHFLTKHLDINLQPNAIVGATEEVTNGVTKPESSQLYKCKICGDDTSFEKPGLLFRHMKNVHKFYSTE